MLKTPLSRAKTSCLTAAVLAGLVLAGPPAALASKGLAKSDLASGAEIHVRRVQRHFRSTPLVILVAARWDRLLWDIWYPCWD